MDKLDGEWVPVIPRSQQAIKFIVERASGKLGRTQLQKILYLADVEARKYLGRPVTELNWVWLHYGPFDQGVYSAVWYLEQLEQIQEIPMDEHEYVYVDLQPGEEPNLTAADRLLLAQLVDRWADLPLWRLKQEAYNTEPMLDAQQRKAQGERLRMDMLNNSCAGGLAELGLDLERMAAGKERFDRGEPGIPIGQVIDELLGSS